MADASNSPSHPRDAQQTMLALRLIRGVSGGLLALALIREEWATPIGWIRAGLTVVENVLLGLASRTSSNI